MTSLGRKRLIAFGGIFLGVVIGVVALANWASQPSWSLLATDVEPDAMNSVVEKLKTMKVAYQLDPGGRSVRVDASRVDELRLQLASEGLPSSGRIGFELFDRTTFGATELTEKVNFQRALEGELARTIAALGTVSAARVHLALPRTSLFAHESEPAKASVVLRMKSGRGVSASEVDGIVALVASAVEGLEPAAVTVIDATGRRLSKEIDPTDGAERGRYDRQTQVEKDTAARVVALLEPVVGLGHVRANVSATLTSDSEEETEERWDPTTVVRSKQQTTEADGRPVAAGAAGARANLPQTDAGKDKNAPPAPTPAPSFNTTSKSSEVTNYEVSKLTRHKISPSGQVSRLSVAVLVDDVKTVTRESNGQEHVKSTPRSREELQKLQALVASAVGLVPDRGDQITVDNIAFDVPESDLPPVAPVLPTWQRVGNQVRDSWPLLAAAAAIAALVVGACAYLFRSQRKHAALSLPATNRAAATAGAPASAPTRNAPVDDDIAEPLPSPARQLARLAQTEPEQLARIVRGWLAEEERS